MERDIILHGVHLGEHSFEEDKMIEEINERAVKKGLNFVEIRVARREIPRETYVKWAKFMAEKKIYFAFLYTVQFAPPEKGSMLDKETVDAIREVAGEYFLGDMLGETGSSGACKAAGYFVTSKTRGKDPAKIETDCADMEEAHQKYIERVSGFVGIDKKLGMPEIFSGEATALNKYNVEAGTTIPALEMMCGNPEPLIAATRGVAKMADSKLWGTYIAHEWYGGFRHSDMLKRKRLQLAYKYAYLSGTNLLCLESGDECIDSYAQSLDGKSEVCQDYRDILEYMSKYIKEDFRPKGGPKVKFAFVSGRHDAWGGWGGTSIWNQFHREEWGHNEAEHSWRLLDEVGTKRNWSDGANFGEEDTSASPAYGMYDIVPIEAPLDKFLQYDHLVFMGWNTMTDEDMDKLYEYVRRGGRILMSAAHLNTNAKRTGEYIPITNGKIERLFGARFTGEVRRTNDGVKFDPASIDEKILYPGTADFACDPVYSGGYANWGVFELTGGKSVAYAADSFGYVLGHISTVVENRIGDGVATLVTSTNYPGYPALSPLYRAIVREFISASARSCEVRVFGSDRVKWSYYDGGKMYLLNTDYDVPATVKIKKGNVEKIVTVDSLELKSLEV